MFLLALVFILLSGSCTFIGLFQREPAPKVFMSAGAFAGLAIASAILAHSLTD